MTDTIVRVPAEWEPYSTVMVAWPHADTDWADMLEEVDKCYLGIARAVAKSGLRLLVVTPEPARIETLLKDFRKEDYLLFEAPTNDTWTRDYGPITLISGDKTCAVDFQFNGWGLKFAANLDNMVNLRMRAASLLTQNYLPRLNFTFEGGAMEVDGCGTMLTTSECLLSLNRNGIINKEQLREYFKQTLGITCLHFLDHGHLDGDDTDSHIDTLARLAPDDTILYVKSYNRNDPHTPDLDKMEEELQQLRTPGGHPYNLIALPLPDPIYHGEERLPATYANFLITPRTILMPTYGQGGNDELARKMLAIAFPDREIIGVDCRALIRQHGSLHCATMQLKEEMLLI